MIVQTPLNSLLAALPEPRSTAHAEGPKPSSAEFAATRAEPDMPPVEPTNKELATAVDRVNHSLQLENRSLQFSIDDATERVIVKVVDKESGETVREIPPKEVLAIAEAIDRFQKGLLLSQKA